MNIATKKWIFLKISSLILIPLMFWFILNFISRIREDKTIKNGLNLWIVSDNLLRGAALNAVEIAETLIKNDYYGK